jgi:hypothetical protein
LGKKEIQPLTSSRACDLRFEGKVEIRKKNLPWKLKGLQIHHACGVSVSSPERCMTVDFASQGSKRAILLRFGFATTAHEGQQAQRAGIMKPCVPILPRHRHQNEIETWSVVIGAAARHLQFVITAERAFQCPPCDQACDPRLRVGTRFKRCPSLNDELACRRHTESSSVMLCPDSY